MAVGTLGVLTIAGTTAIYYTASNTRSAERSGGDRTAFSLAEAGLNDAVAVLAVNNALNPSLLPPPPPSTSAREEVFNADGTVTTSSTCPQTSSALERVCWGGVLTQSVIEGQSFWTVTSTGIVRNPNGPDSAAIRRTIRAEVPIVLNNTQSLENPAWQYIYSRQTGNVCDMTLDNTVEVKTNLYVAGNLCFNNSSKVLGSPYVKVIVHGTVTMTSNQNAIGSSTDPVAEAHIDDGCKYNGATSFRDPCVQGAHTAGDDLWASTISSTPVGLPPPVASYDAWYLNASPGPYYGCLESSGTPPQTGNWATTFDNDQGTSGDASKRNNSLGSVGPGYFQLTPASSYSCKTASGELTWNATSKLLTVKGTMYIDGDLRIENGVTNQYNGQGVIYVSGSIVFKNSKLCGGVSGSNCDFTAWNPNSEMLTLVAAGDAGQPDIDTGYSIALGSSHFQGSLYAEKKLDMGQTSGVDGPMNASEVVVGQSVTTDDYPVITTVPTGQPGQTPTYSSPGRPASFGG